MKQTLCTLGLATVLLTGVAASGFAATDSASTNSTTGANTSGNPSVPRNSGFLRRRHADDADKGRARDLWDELEPAHDFEPDGEPSSGKRRRRLGFRWQVSPAGERAADWR